MLQFRGVTYYLGPAQSIHREIKAKKADHEMRAKIQYGPEAVYLSGKDLARCLKEKFDLDAPKELMEATIPRQQPKLDPSSPLSDEQEAQLSQALQQTQPVEQKPFWQRLLPFWPFKPETLEEKIIRQSEALNRRLDRIKSCLIVAKQAEANNPYLAYADEAVARGLDEYGKPVETIIDQSYQYLRPIMGE